MTPIVQSRAHGRPFTKMRPLVWYALSLIKSPALWTWIKLYVDHSQNMEIDVC